MNERMRSALMALEQTPDAESAAVDGAGPGAGASADQGGVSIDERRVWRSLATVIDPEIGLDIVTVGLVYGLECGEGHVRVTFTLTTPFCPLEEVIRNGIEQAVAAVENVETVSTDLVWEPRWHPGMIREGAW